MKLSIVATLYQSESYVQEFVERASVAARRLVGNDFEVVLVNDGSPDGSLKIAIDIAESESNVVVVDLSRNFGHHKAMMTGLERAGGERVFLIDVDLEEEPEWLLDFWMQLEREGCDVVYGVQSDRKGGVFERWSGNWFYKFFRGLTGMSLPTNAVTARLMSRRYVDALLAHREREVFMAGLWHITGFDQRAAAIRKHSTSESTYTLARKAALLVNSVTSFSNAPLMAISYIGLTISALASLYTVLLVVNWLVLARPPTGWTSVMASIWLLGGLIISGIGVVGIYVAKVFSETKQRPYTIVRKVYGRRESGSV